MTSTNLKVKISTGDRAVIVTLSTASTFKALISDAAAKLDVAASSIAHVQYWHSEHGEVSVNDDETLRDAVDDLERQYQRWKGANAAPPSPAVMTIVLKSAKRQKTTTSPELADEHRSSLGSSSSSPSSASATVKDAAALDARRRQAEHVFGIRDVVVSHSQVVCPFCAVEYAASPSWLQNMLFSTRSHIRTQHADIPAAKELVQRHDQQKNIDVLQRSALTGAELAALKAAYRTLPPMQGIDFNHPHIGTPTLSFVTDFAFSDSQNSVGSDGFSPSAMMPLYLSPDDPSQRLQQNPHFQ